MSSPQAHPVGRAVPGALAAYSARLAAARTPGELRALLTDLPGELTSLDQRMLFEGRTKARLDLTADATVLILLGGFLPGASGEPHDHVGSLGGVRVLRGTASVRRFILSSSGPRLASRDTYLPGSVLVHEGSEIIALGAEADSPDPVVLLHVYLPMPVIRVYSAEGAR